MNSKFEQLAAQMQQLEENQQGQLKGGFASAEELPGDGDGSDLAGNNRCTNHGCLASSDNTQCTNHNCR